MGHGYKHGGVGGGKKENPLNFEVVAYPSEVEMNTATPEAYTIGVVTTNPITGWHFTVEQPEKLEEGELWFETGDSSEVAFNALKENTIQVYPKSVKQWVSGELKDVVTKIYRGGTWVVWDAGIDGTIVFDRSTQTFDSISAKFAECFDNTNYIYAEDANPYVLITTKSGNAIERTMQWTDAIDFTPYDRMELVGYGSDSQCHFGIAGSRKSGTSYTLIAELAKMYFTTTETKHELSLSGVNTTGYIGFYLTASGKAWIKSIKLIGGE